MLHQDRVLNGNISQQVFRILEIKLRMEYNSNMSEGRKIIAQNKKARYDYSVDDTYECGIVLEGTEVKSFKTGNISFPDAFAEIQNPETNR